MPLIVIDLGSIIAVIAISEMLRRISSIGQVAGAAAIAVIAISEMLRRQRVLASAVQGQNRSHRDFRNAEAGIRSRYTRRPQRYRSHRDFRNAEAQRKTKFAVANLVLKHDPYAASPSCSREMPRNSKRRINVSSIRLFGTGCASGHAASIESAPRLIRFLR